MASRGISVRRSYSTVFVSLLDDLIPSIVRMHPHAGYRMVQAYLFAEGHRVSERAVRNALERIGPIGNGTKMVQASLYQHRGVGRQMTLVRLPGVGEGKDGCATHTPC